jgi:Cd2+/Zn2+-exporting ATPase
VLFFSLPLPLGVVGHEGSTIIVVLNGLRLLRTPGKHRIAQAQVSPTLAAKGV